MTKTLVLSYLNCNEICILDIDLNCINLDDNSFDEDDPDTIVHIILLAWHTEFGKRKPLRKNISKQMPAA